MKISVITVCFNSDSTILDCINSVVSQSYKNVEYIVIDGGSYDNTVNIINSFGEQINVFVSESDNGIYDAMNKGFSFATGDIVGFLNSDDFFADSNVLSKIASSFRDSSVQACYGDLDYISHDKVHTLRKWKSGHFKYGSFSKGWAPPHPTFYVKTSEVRRLGCFDLQFKIAADNELMMRYLEVAKIKVSYIPHVLVKMRVGGISNRSWSGIFKQNIEILRAIKKNKLNVNHIIFFGTKAIKKLLQMI